MKFLFKEKITEWAQNLFQFFIFTNIFISAIAVIMTYGIIHFFATQIDIRFYILIFFSTLASYCLHWYYSNEETDVANEITTMRSKWNSQFKNILLVLFIASVLIIFIIFFTRTIWIIFFIPTALATLIYTTPKLPIPLFKRLQGKALAKTFYLTAIWVYVTCILPIQVSNIKLNKLVIYYIVCEFLLIYLICLLFDYRDQKKEKVNFVLINTNKHFYTLFQLVSAAFILMLPLFYYSSCNLIMTIAFLGSFLLVYLNLNKSINTNNDYWYYFILDAFMMMPTLIYSALRAASHL
jgi:hypothetical protein